MIVMLVSFDIFDTALIRKCGDAENVFWILAQRLYPEHEAKREDFLTWRRHAGEKAKGPTLDDIYANADGLFLPYSIERLKSYELEIEASQLVSNPLVREAINRYRAAGDVICFISDMYLSSKFLADLLRREECLVGDERVFVSCEWNARKDTGELYDVVRNELKPGKWRHYGDNLRCDVKRAKQHGIKAQLVTTGYTSQEKSQLQAAIYCHHSHELRMLAGLTRYARMVAGNRPESILAADFLVPAYTPYVLWTLEQAESQGVKRLFFLSRDGWILRCIAQRLNTKVECTDLFVSRKALILPWLTLHFSEHALLSVEDHHTLIGRKIADILGHLKLTALDLQKYGIQFDYERITSSEQELEFLKELFHSEFTISLQHRARDAYTRLLGYLTQSGMLDSISSAMVDIGWIGTSRRMLNDILRHEGAEEIPTFYYSVRRDVLPCKYGRYEAYFPEGTLSTELTLAIENYLSASPYPTTLDYILANGQWRPEWVETNAGELWNPVIRANGEVSGLAANAIKEHQLSKESLMLWAKNANERMLSLRSSIILAPLAKVGDFDGKNFVRRLTIWECIKRILLGERITAWDNASLALTCGFRFKNLLWPMCEFAGKIRAFFYRRFLCRRSE